MSTLDTAKKAIEKEFEIFSKKFDGYFSSDNELLSAVNNYILQKKGKQIRPIMALLAAKCLGDVNDSSYDGATAIEMLHTASLIHDDIVDEADSRRGQKSINNVWQNKVSVLVGDYLLSQALNVASQTDSLEIIKSICTVGKKLTDGELIQLYNSKNRTFNEDIYYNVIKKKTAVLFSTACFIGAKSVSNNQQMIDSLVEFGTIFGICFQIRDDIFDYLSTEKEIGKPVGNDIREGKATLPLIYAINNISGTKRDEIIDTLRKENKTNKEVEQLINFTIEMGGIEYASKKMKEFEQEGIKCLDSIPDSEAKKALLMLLNYTLVREY